MVGTALRVYEYTGKQRGEGSKGQAGSSFHQLRVKLAAATRAPVTVDRGLIHRLLRDNQSKRRGNSLPLPEHTKWASPGYK